MTNVAVAARAACKRGEALALRLEQGAQALVEFVKTLSQTEWDTPVPGDGRSVGVVVHHVADIYPLEIQVAQSVAAGEPILGVTWSTIHELNASHAEAAAGVAKEPTLDLLERNSADAAAAIRRFTEEELARAVPVSLYAGAPLTCQFILEDHAVRHSLHHLAAIRRAVRR